MSLAKIKPFRDYSEHDVVNLFSLDTATGDMGLLVKIKGDGWKNNDNHGIAWNEFEIKNVYSPRWEVKSKVTVTTSGDRAFGMTLYKVLEENQFGYPLRYDPVRLQEAQAVVSGQAVPILRKGTVLYNFGTVTGVGAVNPGPGSGLIPSTTVNGGLAVVHGLNQTLSGGSVVRITNLVGECLGKKDADGYALINLDFYK
ncbi:MAG: hypothetical protein HC836_12725 [Richelia sp. RM2_1_2]|nr:hypothetical protein [Richelia sp. RM2_1_2]